MDKELISENEIEAKLNQFSSWISNQSDLPQKINKLLLLRFLKVAKWRVEKAQRFFSHSIRLRSSNPHIFSQRDPMSENISKVFDVIDMVPLPILSSKNYKIMLFRLIKDDLDDVRFDDVVKAFFMISDVFLITKDHEDRDLSDGEIPIFDMEKVSYRHLTKVVISTVRLYMKYTQEAHPVHIRQIHIINCNPIIDKIIFLIKPFIRAENFNMINFHTKGSDTLFKFIEKELLPNEFGGLAGSLSSIKSIWIEKMKFHRDYLTNDGNWKLVKDENNNISFDGNGKTALDFLC